MKEESVHIFPSIEKLADFFVEFFSESIKEKTGSMPFYMALSGGSTPREIFRFLAENFRDKIDWTKVMIFWGDERCVNPDSDESNYRMAFESLIKNINIPAGNIFRIEAEKDPEEETERYSELVKSLLPHEMNVPRFDLIMLGLGEDGHTASIFPYNIDLFKSEKLYETSMHPDSGQMRITATGKIINHAKHVCFLVTGASKAKRVAQILQKDTDWKDLPASRVNLIGGKLTWLMDEPAGQFLSNRSLYRH